jgi:phenylpropionate dioxygenase-like ring-hydroxylating dioxygenase large terminal subunit
VSEGTPREPLHVDPDPRRARALPAWAYTGAAHFEREVAVIFHRSWQYVGPVTQLARSGDYATVAIARQSVLVVRGEDGVLRGFHNVCRHRGHPLLEGRGCVGRVVCPYHAWSYGLDGRLRTARGAEGSPALADVALAPVRVEVLAGKFVFCNLDPEAPPLASIAGGLVDELRAEIPDFDTLAPVERAPPPEGRIAPPGPLIRANWKVVVDNCLECNHCRPIHPAFVRLIDMKGFRTAAHAHWASLKGELAEPSTVPATARNRSYRFWWLWPSTYFEMAPGGAHGVTVGSTQPVDVETSTPGRSDRYGLADAPLFEPRGYGDLNLVPEDYAAMEAVQRGLHSQGYVRGHYNIDPAQGETNEATVHRFHQLVVEALGS